MEKIDDGIYIITDNEEEQWVCDIINEYIRNNLDEENGFKYDEIDYSIRRKKVYFINKEEKLVFNLKKSGLTFAGRVKIEEVEKPNENFGRW